MKNLSIVGIDVSKRILDAFILSCNYHFQVVNSPSGFVKLLEICCLKLNLSTEQLHICFEHTGRYSRLLAVFLEQSEITFSQIPALDIKASKGISRGKTDKSDARDIAFYARRKKDELKPTILNSAQTSELRQLITLRDKLIKHRTAYKNSIKDLQDCYHEGETDFIKITQCNMIGHLNQEIKNVEDRIDCIIDSMPDWKMNYKLIKSVRGIGPVIARYLIIYTENFTRFKNYKKFACYAGIAPFEYTSGSSVKGRTRVHPCANKQLKSLLNMAAMNAIKINGEYKQYYQRRQNEGKNNMSTLNIIRNKLLARIFAVVKRQTQYVDLHKFAA
jgi:transposase